MIVSRQLLVGIGSAHGDDQVGWLVVDQVSKLLPDAAVRCVQTPAELLDWLGGLERLDLCDAIESAGPSGVLERWTWPAAELARVPFRSSHDLSLVATLRLADELKLLPPVVRIWGIAIRGARAMDGISSEIAAAVPEIAKRICEELAGQRKMRDSIHT